MFFSSITVANNAAAQTPYLSRTSLTRSIQENLAIGTKVGEPMKGIDPDGDTITYGITYGIGSYAYFAINRTTGQLSTKQVLDYEADTSHTIRVSVNDPGGNSNSYDITINVINDTSDDNTGNRPPAFIEGDSTTRNIILSDPNSLYLGSPILATDPDGGTLYYAVTNDPSGILYMGNPAWENTVKWRHENLSQLKHQVPPDFRSLSDTYTAELTVWDDQNATDSIQITINIVAKNTPPIFLDGSSVTRSITENTEASIDIGTPIYAIDCEDRDLTYSLGGTDAAFFSINTNIGQLQTLAALDYETKNTYTVTVKASDGNGGSDSITVTINVIDVAEVVPNNPPMFSDGAATTRSIAENTPSGRNIGGAVTATDPDSDTLTYSLSGSNAASFSIDSSTGQLRTAAALDYETKKVYNLIITATDTSGATANITITINVTDVNETVTPPPMQQQQPNSQQPPVQQNNPPVFSDGTSTTRSIAENTAIGTDIGSPISATDADTGDILTYSLSGTNAASFSIDSSTGQLRTAAALDYETKKVYNLIITATDTSGATANITITINVTDVNETVTPPPVQQEPNPQQPPVQQNNLPVFSDGTSTTRNVAENTASGTDIGSPVSATDADTGDTLTYSLSGSNAASFSIDSSTGQLRTAAALDYETKKVYNLIITATDTSGATANITITINVTDVNETVTPPPMQQQQPNSQQPPVQQNNPPVFSDGTSTTRSIAENIATGTDIGSPVSATDADTGDILTYSLSGTDAASFSIDSSTGQLRTAAALDYETKKVYNLIITATDTSGATANITITINVTDVNETVTPPPVQQEPNPQQPPVQQNNLPVFSDGASTTRSIAENAATDTDIGNPVTATDADTGDILTYSLSGTDAASFSIDSSTGQLRTAAALDYETKNIYNVRVDVLDSMGGSDSITVTINVEPNYTIIPFDYKRDGVGKIVFSEIMLSKTNRATHADDLPQWIELYNTTDQDIDMNGWKIVGRYLNDSNTMNPLDSQVISKPLTITGKGTVLIVNYAIPNSRNSISLGLVEKTEALGSNNKNFWNYEGFVLELQDAAGNPVDRIGNLNEKDTIVWEIQKIIRDERVSLVRRLKSVRTQKYNFSFGMKEFGWFPANEVERLAKGRNQYYYGSSTDIGSPGYRSEDAEILPVTLSSFNPQINQEGSVVISWITESEVDNAGFNILRSNAKKGPFVMVNPKLIQGAGTTGEHSAYTWMDTTAKPNIEYYYQIEDVSFAGIKQTLVTQRLKGIHTAKNRALTSWGIIKQYPNK